MKAIKDLLNNTATLILLLVLGVGVVLFVSNRTQQPVTQQQPKSTVVPAEPTISPAEKPTYTPEPTRIITVIPVVVTVYPTPTPAPSPTPTPTFEPLSDKPIMGFVFKPPQEISNTRSTAGYWEIVDWLPDSSEEAIIKGPLTLERINVISGTVKQYAKVESPGNIFQPIWLPEAQGVAYLTGDFQTAKTNLWLGKAESEPDILLSDVKAPLIPLEKGRGVAVYHNNDKAMRSVSPDKQNLRPSPQPIAPPFPQMTPGKLLDTAYQPNGDWIAYYNFDGFQLVDSKSGDVRMIDLGGNQFEPSWAMDAKWSPDGQKLALIVTQGQFPIPFSNLYILDWPSGILHKVDSTFTYVTDIAWAPDSVHLLLKPIVGETKDGLAITALYMTNVSTFSEFVPVPIPTQGLTGSGSSLSWSPDGQTVLVEYFDGKETAIYKIDVVVR